MQVVVMPEARSELRKGMLALRLAELDFQETERRLQRVAAQLELVISRPLPLPNPTHASTYHLEGPRDVEDTGFYTPTDSPASSSLRIWGP
jgi:hypothetical protein